MSARLGWARVVLAGALALGCAAVLAPKALGQDNADEGVKRKVKTRIMPEYPLVARQLSLQGKVKIETTISAEGRVTGVKVVGGNPVLAAAAQDALKKWRFEPAPKDTTEIIEIDFAGGGQ
jgi:TonB family protein